MRSGLGVAHVLASRHPGRVSPYLTLTLTLTLTLALALALALALVLALSLALALALAPTLALTLALIYRLEESNRARVEHVNARLDANAATLGLLATHLLGKSVSAKVNPNRNPDPTHPTNPNPE